MKVLIYLFLITIMASCGGSNEPRPIDRPTVESPSSLRWINADLPIVITIPQDFTNDQTNDVIVSGRAWEEALCKYRGLRADRCHSLFFIFVNDTNNSYATKPTELFESLYDNNSVAYKMVNSWFEKRSDAELATTTLLFSENVMVSSDILFNFFQHNFGDADINPTVFDFQSVFIHELGHLLGFNHVVDGRSVMQAKISKGELRREIFTFSGNACQPISGEEGSFVNQSECQELKLDCETTCGGEWIPTGNGDAFNLLEKYNNIAIP